MRTLSTLGLSLLLSTAAHAGDIQSISRLEFGPSNTIFLADWKRAALHAVTLPGAAPVSAGTTFNVRDLEAVIGRVVGKERFVVEDMVVRPGTAEVYLAVSIGAKKKPALLIVSNDSKARRIDLAAGAPPRCP
ncbi:hypothetical protein LP419_04385 [Massilia sp. H-1]|nr:hypothetical protein LP419_04385 [Massilia sp. H-1]